jgi:hypothetical protein
MFRKNFFNLTSQFSGEDIANDIRAIKNIRSVKKKNYEKRS